MTDQRVQFIRGRWWLRVGIELCSPEYTRRVSTCSRILSANQLRSSLLTLNYYIAIYPMADFLPKYLFPYQESRIPQNSLANGMVGPLALPTTKVSGSLASA